ncbi:hypothetical protein O6H91_Y249400 [Diphasiastrum complanatum]|nr:hypothetical protein O6H91_Y249400 [Diphasiastrum complanatum]
MARIHLMPQSCPSQSQKQFTRPLVRKHDPHLGVDANAIDEIADGLEKMLQSWADAAANKQESIQSKSSAKAEIHNCSHETQNMDSMQLNQVQYHFSKLVHTDKAAGVMMPLQSIDSSTDAAEPRHVVLQHSHPAHINSPGISTIVPEEAILGGEMISDQAIINSANYWFVQATEGSRPTGGGEKRARIEVLEDHGPAVYNVVQDMERNRTNVLQLPEDTNAGLNGMQTAITEEDSADYTHRTSAGLPAKVTYCISSGGATEWTETVVNGDKCMKKLLGKRTNSFSSKFPTSLLKSKREPADDYKEKVEELEIALEESCAEYEVKSSTQSGLFKKAVTQIEKAERHATYGAY